MVVRHVRGLDISTIARRVYEEQKLQKWPGLVREAAAICEMLGLEDANEVDMTRWNTKQYRNIIIEACKLKDEKELREAAAGLKKCERIMEDHYGKNRAATLLRICGNLRQRGLPLWVAKPLRQTGLSADLVKTRKILTDRQKNLRLQGGTGKKRRILQIWMKIDS